MVSDGDLSKDQERVFALLADAATHGISEPVKRIDTHGAVVFLAGPHVYKVKRAVSFPFMDLSTLELRRVACEAEVRVNRAFTSDLYLGTIAITKDDSTLRLGGVGEPVEWVVHLKRFDENRTLDLVAARGELTPALLAKVATLVLSSHRRAKLGDGLRATEHLGSVIEDSLSELIEAPDMFPAGETAELAAALRSAFTAVRTLLVARGANGRVRRCHGDLHLRNIALCGDEPILFDAIEFDEAIATTDVLYDLAFVLMDLWERGWVGEANLLLNRYLWGCEDIGVELAGLAALPPFLSLRAAVRAKIDVIRAREVQRSQPVRDEALRYFDIARAFLEPAPPLLIAIGGLSGTGKTTLATRIASSIGRAPGAVHLRSDIERKRRFGVAELDHLPEMAYGAEVTDQVFAALRAQADAAIGAGQSVIVDAVHSLPGERDLIAAVAARAGVRFVGLWLEAPLDALIERVIGRHHDASDASVEIVMKQSGRPTGEVKWRRLDASVSVDAMEQAARSAGAW